jgi:filamentous hemagglutinin
VGGAAKLTAEQLRDARALMVIETQTGKKITSEALGIALGKTGSGTVVGDELAARLTPQSFGFSTVADNPQSLQMWNDAMRSAASASRPNGYTRYLDTLASGQNPSQQILEDAFSAVNSRFVKSARNAGQEIAQVHHWNFGKTDFPTQIVDPRHLVPVPSREAHLLIHQQTSETTNIWVGPISPLHRIEIPEWSTPLAPKW